MGISLLDLNIFERKCLLTGIKIRLSSRIEVGVKQLIAIVTESGDIVLYYIFGGLTPVLKHITWFTDTEKYIQSISFDPSATWLLVATSDVSLYIIPALYIVDAKQKIDCKWKLNDVTYFGKHDRTPNSKPLCVIWWQTLDSNQNAILGHENGCVSFISLTDGQNIGTCSISEAVRNLHICQDNSLDSITLLITNIIGQQWRLLLEQRSTGFIWSPESNSKIQTTIEYAINGITNGFYDENKSSRSRLQGLKQLSVEKLASLKQKLAETRARGITNNSKAIAEDQKSTSSNDSTNSQNDPGIPEKLSHLYETYLCPQFARNRYLFSGYYKPTSILTIHSVDIDVIPMFVHKLFPNCQNILVTDRFFYIVNDELNRLSIVSCQFSESRLDGDTEFNPESLISEFQFKDPEKILSIYRLSDLNMQAEMDHDSKKTQKTFVLAKSESDLCIRRPKIDTCIIVTNLNVYKIVLSGSIIEKFVSLVTEDLILDKAERLATMFGLNLHQLLEYSGDLLLSQEKFARAIALYRLSKCRILKSVLKFAVSGHCQELLSYIMVCLSATNTDMSVSTKRHLSNLAIMSYTELLLRSSANSLQRISVFQKYLYFLTYNEYYDEVLAVNVVCQTNLWSILTYLGRIRAVNFDIIEVLLKTLKSPPIESTPASAPSAGELINDSFHYCISEKFFLQCILCKPNYSKMYLKYIKENINDFSIDTLKRLSNNLDPSYPTAIPILTRVFQRHRLQQSSSLDSTLDSVDSEPPDELLQSTTDLIETFIFVLIVLINRMGTDNFDVELLNLVEVQKTAKTIPRSISGVLSPKPRILSAGFHHVGLVRNSSLYTWGSTSYGALGLGPMITKYGLPQQVGLLNDYQVEVIGISCGKCHTVALTNYGLYVWGANNYGQLGLGVTLYQAAYPTLLEELCDQHIVDIACGQYHTLVLNSEGQVFSWGWGVYGQLGHGCVEDCSRPKLVEFFKDRIVTQISAGHAHSIALTSDGIVYSFGSNNFGQLGNGTSIKSNIPVQILLNEKITLIATNYFHNLAVGLDNKLYIWGASPQVLRHQVQNYKRIKQFDKSYETAPIDWSLTTQFSIDNRHLFPALLPTENVEGPITQIATGCSHSALLTKNGFLYTWGQNFEGQIGNNSKNEVSSPTLVKINPISTFSSLNVGSTDLPLKCNYISCGAEFTVVIDHAGKVLGWGNNSKAQLGKISEEDERSLEGKMVVLKATKRILRIPKTGQSSNDAPKEIPNIPTLQITYKSQFSVNRITSQFYPLRNIENNLSLITYKDLGMNWKRGTVQSDDEFICTFGQKTLHYVLENYFNFYDAEFILQKAVEYKNFQAASKISYLGGHYCDSLGFLLTSFKNFIEKNRQPTREVNLPGCGDIVQPLNIKSEKSTPKRNLSLSVISNSCSLESIKQFNDDFFSQGGFEELCDTPSFHDFNLQESEPKTNTEIIKSDKNTMEHNTVHNSTEKLNTNSLKTNLIHKLDISKINPSENFINLQETLTETNETVPCTEKNEHNFKNLSANELDISNDVIRKTIVSYVESLEFNNLTTDRSINESMSKETILEQIHVSRNDSTISLDDDNSNNFVCNDPKIVNPASQIIEFYCKKPQIIENHILMQNILIKLMQFWLTNNLPVDVLEDILLKNMDKYFYPLSILLFCKNFNNNLGEGMIKDHENKKTQKSFEFLKRLSTKFCLQLCSMVLQNVNKS